MEQEIIFKPLNLTVEEAEERLNNLEGILNEFYPDLPDISEKEFFELKDGCAKGDKKSREILELFALKHCSKSIVCLYLQYDFDYDFVDALSDSYMISKEILKDIDRIDSFKIFIPYVKAITMVKFKNQMKEYAGKNLDVSERAREQIQVPLDSAILDGEDDVVSVIFKKEFKDKFEEVLSTLKGAEIKTLKLYFGIDEKDDKTLEEIGEYYGVPKETIEPIITKGLRKLTHPKRTAILKELGDELD